VHTNHLWLRAVTAPSDSDEDPNSSVNAAATPRATDTADEATRDGAWRGRAASSRKSAGRQAKARAAHHDHDTDDHDYDVNAAGGRKSEARRRAARKRRYSPQDFNTYDGADDEGRKTKAGEGTPKAAYAEAASGAATQARNGNPKSDHEATSKADQVEESGEEAYSKAYRCGGTDPRWARNNPMKNRASAEALPKFSSAASANPMKNRASAYALPKFSFSSAAATNPPKNRANAEALPKFSFPLRHQPTP
jgi:hypothetical protein